MKLSVILPVYNAQRSVRRCMRSVLGQSERDLELIVVDDGSTDRSAEICKEEAAKDPRVVLVSQDNQGLSAARNAGLGRARGEWITFVDSDDTLSPDTLQEVFDAIAARHADADLVEYPAFVYLGNLKKEHLLRLTDRDFASAKGYWLGTRAYTHCYAWNKFYRRRLFDGVLFPPGRLFEDAWTLPRLLERCRKVATVDAGLYNYNWNPRGITALADGKALTDLLEAHLQVLPAMHDADYYAAVLNIALDVYAATGRVPGGWIDLPYNNTWKLKLLHKIGLEKLCRLNKIIHLFHKPRS